MYGDIVRTFVEKNNIDIFIITSPFDCSLPPYKKEWFGGAVVYCIVYDIIPYIMRKQYLQRKEAYDIYMRYLEALRICDDYLVISESVRDDLISYLGIGSESIHVIFGAYDKCFRRIDITTAEKAGLYERFGIRDGFIMCTGGDDYRKNISGLIEAYSMLPKKLRAEHQLVIVCKLSRESEYKYNDEVRRRGLTGSVVLTNFVSTEDLIMFYNLAYLMAFPSKYEGFGLPVVEAWACGTPVLTSNNSSLGEVAGEGAVLVNPFDVRNIAKGLEYALTEAKLDEMLEIGKKRLRDIFNWDNVALLAYKALMHKKDVCEENSRSSEQTKAEKKTVAMFTPLSPLRSGISDYSEDIIRSLARWFDIDVFIDSGYSAGCTFPSNVSVYSHDKYPAMREKYHDTVYQIGNSVYHVYMYDYIERYGGTVVLHDYNLNDVVVLMHSKGRQKLYEKFVYSDYRDEEAENIFRTGLTSQTPLNGLVVNPAHRVIVHDKHLKEGLLKRNIGKKVFVIPHYAKPEVIPEETDSIRERFGYSRDDIIFAAFGIIAATKRIIPLLSAFKRVLEIKPEAKLLLCGKPEKPIEKELESFIDRNDLKRNVKVTGFVELEDFLNYIDICDVCFNLRYPYNGESSGSLARILAKGRPVAVNRIGSFDSVPDEACIKLPSVENMSGDEEIDNIYDVMKSYIDDPEEFAKIAANGRKFAEEELDLRVVAEKYRDALMSSVRCGITRKVSDRILELVKDGAYSVADRKALAHTIAYSKNEV